MVESSWLDPEGVMGMEEMVVETEILKIIEKARKRSYLPLPVRRAIVRGRCTERGTTLEKELSRVRNLLKSA